MAIPAMRAISTHAPLARCDINGTCQDFTSKNFNSRTSCEVRHAGRPKLQANRHFNSRTSCEVRRNRPRLWRVLSTFQLTHLLRGATHPAEAGQGPNAFQLTHLLRGATTRCCMGTGRVSFQLTHLLRGATNFVRNLPMVSDFNSRTSCEVRQNRTPEGHDRENFNSRTSCEVRQVKRVEYDPETGISTHAPLARCDLPVSGVTLDPDNFNSRTSCEVRPGHKPDYRQHLFDFNSRTSCEVRQM